MALIELVLTDSGFDFSAETMLQIYPSGQKWHADGADTRRFSQIIRHIRSVSVLSEVGCAPRSPFPSIVTFFQKYATMDADIFTIQRVTPKTAAWLCATGPTSGVAGTVQLGDLTTFGLSSKALGCDDRLVFTPCLTESTARIQASTYKYRTYPAYEVQESRH